MKKTRRQPVKKKPVSRIHHNARMALLPHRKNSYRPHLIRWQGLTFILAFVVALQFAYNYSQSGNVLGREINLSVEQLLSDTNDQRKKDGVEPLVLNDKLDQAANLKATDMFAQQYWAHNSPSGAEPWQWFGEAGYSYSLAGENLAKDFSTSGGVVAAWMNSPEHRKNLLDSRYENIGFAIRSGTLNGEKTTVVVALYGSPSANSLAASERQVLAATGSQPFIARIGLSLTTMNPSVLATVVILMFVSSVALVAHQYRAKLPKQWRTSWRRHHGLYKAVGSASFALVVVTLYTGGQI